MELRLYLPQYNELLFREQLLSDPETMAFNRFKEPSPDYHPETGCIDFPRGTWALWYDFWMDREPDNFYAVIFVCRNRDYIIKLCKRSNI